MRRPASLVPWGAALAGLWAGGCASVPEGRLVVDVVQIQGVQAVDTDDIEKRLATAPSPRFLGLFRGIVYDYSVFDPRTLDLDLERIERLCRARGYYDARVRAGRVREHDGHVSVEIEVDEGAPVLVESVTLAGLDALAADRRVAVERAARPLRVGNPFDEEIAQQIEPELARALTDRGHAFAAVKRRTEVDLVARTAAVTYEIDPGPECVLGEITIEGLGVLPELPVRRALALVPGRPYSTAEIEQARVSALDLGVFTSVEITPSLAPTSDPRPQVAVVVRVEPAELRAIRLGGGVEMDLIRSDVHGRIGWEHANFLGGFRHLAIDLRPGLVFYPTRFPSLERPQHLLPDMKSSVALSQPGFLEARTTGTLRVEFNIYPVLLSPQVDPAASVLGYREIRGLAGLNRTFWKFYGQLSYNIQRNDPFTYVGPLDPSLSGVTISYLDLLTQFDFRNDKVEPHKGFLLSNDLQLAGGLLLGNARDVRVQPDARIYLPTSRHTTLAIRGSLGFLFPLDYGSTLLANADTGGEPAGVDRATWVQDVQLVYLRAFFSGGPSSNRGYPVRGIGPHGTIPFFNPTLAAQQLASSCDAGSADYSQIRCAQPLGGLSLWELSAELRFPILGALAGAVFCDSSDVSPHRVDLRPAYLHLSCGLGFRYATPVGPVRADFGYRIPGLQILGQGDAAVEGDPGTLFGLPLAIALGIGESF
jgi:outer membrane protein insertion porin family/translocation and assembly module TamA